ncbi:MAG: tetraacyldisaccharide 4'-kinase [Pseudomonadota bacterium]
MNEAPEFWWRRPGILSTLLAPVGAVYGNIAAKRMEQEARFHARVPILCVGNLVAGGAGKTPTALTLGKAAEDAGYTPGFLSRGYGGGIRQPTLVNLDRHNALDVGDEPLVLASQQTTAVSPERDKGAELLEEAGCNFIIMDDGFQNPRLHKDFSLLVVDSVRGVGNGFCIPAGPLRANLGRQLVRADAVLIIGKGANGNKIVRLAARRARPVYEALFQAVEPEAWTEKEVLAYAGIADPGKFYASLQKVGAQIADQRSFGDHHVFSDEECADLMVTAEASKLELVTTSKDAARLKGAGKLQSELLERSEIFAVNLEFDSPRDAPHIVEQTVAAFRKREVAEANRRLKL